MMNQSVSRQPRYTYSQFDQTRFDRFGSIRLSGKQIAMLFLELLMTLLIVSD